MKEGEIAEGLQRLLQDHAFDLSHKERIVLRHAIDALERKAFKDALQTIKQGRSSDDLTPARWVDLEGTTDF